MRPDQDSVLESLYRAHFHEIEIHAFRYLGKWDDAHVAAQETFHIACEKIDDLMKQPNRIAWLKNIAKNVCRNMYRARKKQLYYAVVTFKAGNSSGSGTGTYTTGVAMAKR